MYLQGVRGRLRQDNVRKVQKKYEIYIFPQIAQKSVDIEVESQKFFISQKVQVLSFQMTCLRCSNSI